VNGSLLGTGEEQRAASASLAESACAFTGIKFNIAATCVLFVAPNKHFFQP
jgi:hypothetical protein